MPFSGDLFDNFENSNSKHLPTSIVPNYVQILDTATDSITNIWTL